MSVVPPLRAAVIGLGRMGQHHVRACADSDGLDLVTVFDQHIDQADRVSAEQNCERATDLESLVGQIDIAVIAASTSAHRGIAVPLLSAGISCLVEKPVAVSVEDAQAMIDAAESGKATLCVGHVERFNPAVMALVNALKSTSAISHLHARRLNAPSDRIYDADCILDLMIHDLDLLQVLKSGGLVDVHPQEPADADHADVVLKAMSGLEARLQVSRVASEQHRDLQIQCGNVSYSLDFGARTLTQHTGGIATALNVASHDPLRAQLSAFLDVVRHHHERPDMTTQIASGRDGREALKLASLIRSKLGLL